MKKVVIPLSYLLGISDEICELRFREDYKPEKYAEVPWAHKVRAMMRTRQTVPFEKVTARYQHNVCETNEKE